MKNHRLVKAPNFKKQTNNMKTILFLLVSFTALTALSSGILMIYNPSGSFFQMSESLLNGTPFKNFLVPGIVLALLVGGTNLAAVILNLMRNKNRYNWAIAAGVMISGWIIVQMILISAFSWFQLLYLVIGILTILLAYQLEGKWAA
jgi:FtsH-binding integral membrane protein